MDAELTANQCNTMLIFNADAVSCVFVARNSCSTRCWPALAATLVLNPAPRFGRRLLLHRRTSPNLPLRCWLRSLRCRMLAGRRPHHRRRRMLRAPHHSSSSFSATLPSAPSHASYNMATTSGSVGPSGWDTVPTHTYIHTYIQLYHKTRPVPWCTQLQILDLPVLELDPQNIFFFF
jgi:hypothetical protein